MSFRSKCTAFVVLLMLGYAGSTGLGQVAEPAPAAAPTPPRPPAASTPLLQPAPDDLFGEPNSYSAPRPVLPKYVMKAGARGANNASAILRQAADAVHNAKGDDETTAARKQLTELIEKYFEEDMVQRQKELADLEKRLAKLREQLDRRRTKKQDIVELQAKVLLNEADGLGFYSGERRSDSSLFDANNPFAIQGVIGLPMAPPGTYPTPGPAPTKAAPTR
jgi:hypothetical protein